MPKGLRRYYGAGDLHYITGSCYRRQALLGTPARRDLFLSALEGVRRRYRVVVLGYVVMPEHFHADQRTTAGNPLYGDAGSEVGLCAPGAGGYAAPQKAGQFVGKRTGRTSGSHAFMISMCGASASASRNCAICIAIR